MTVGPAGDLLDGFIDTKSVDWDLTPILGFDIAREGGSYSFACSAREGEPSYPLTCTCTDSGTWTGESKFATSGAGLGNPTVQPRCNHDPEVRSLAGGGNQMVGSYSVHVPECGPEGTDMTWSLCKAGTPCAPLPPLPGSGVADPPDAPETSPP